MNENSVPRCGCAPGCGCGAVAVPVPTEAEAESVDEVEVELCGRCNSAGEGCICSTCGYCGDCCRCYVCRGCEENCRLSNQCDNCEECGSCCSCFVCGGCCRRRRESRRCENCAECDNCCCCWQCPECCGWWISSDECVDCRNCPHCCNCEESSKFLEQDEPRFHKATRGQMKTNPSQRFVAAEIEVAELTHTDHRADILEVCKRWGAAVVEDGSLPKDGFEINTAPASGDKFVAQLEEICQAISAAGGKVSTACGLHVHIDARDFGYWEIRRLIKLYAVIEESLFSVLPQSRQDNTYCVRCGAEYLHAIEGGDPRKIKQVIARAVYKSDKDVNRRRKNKYEAARYSALNLHSWFFRGTVECRAFGGTVDFTKIKNWSLLWAAILDWVYSHTEREVEDAIRGCSNGWELLLQIAPSNTIRRWLNNRRLYRASLNPS